MCGNGVGSIDAPHGAFCRSGRRGGVDVTVTVTVAGSACAVQLTGATHIGVASSTATVSFVGDFIVGVLQ